MTRGAVALKKIGLISNLMPKMDAVLGGVRAAAFRASSTGDVGSIITGGAILSTIKKRVLRLLFLYLGNVHKYPTTFWPGISSSPPPSRFAFWP